ncbi:MAG: Gamma-glutamyl phosphate reductase [Bacilli bacterium]|nr:Gamma-glutamyl phosphate reductase [Bacilli bacterium]
MRLQEQVRQQAVDGKSAAKYLQLASTEQKNRTLAAMAQQIVRQSDQILSANHTDVQAARDNGMGEAKIDRLLLTAGRIQEMADGLLALRDMSDPIGEITERFVRPNGLLLEKRRVPFGLVAMIYESRPNVTVDAAGICLKTGNSVLLRGGKEALHSNTALVSALQAGLSECGFPTNCIQIVTSTQREAIDEIIRMQGLVDLVIPRGGASLIQRIVQGSLVPVVETGIGNCHVYVDCAADLQMASQIIENGKLQRPSVCNATETVLIHQDVSESWILELVTTLQQKGVEVRGCDRIRQIVTTVGEATEEDWNTEYNDLILAIKVVEDLQGALAHIDRYGTKHSETIVTEDAQAAEQFLLAVDAAAVYHNASTRFTDGSQFGFGAEIGISTQKMHARGPMGLKEMTTYKYIGRGSGQTRN